MNINNLLKAVPVLNTTDIACLIQDDAIDTVNKLSEFYPLFSMIITNIGEYEDTSKLSNYLSDLYLSGLEYFTVCLEDGDIMNFELNFDMPGYCGLNNVYTYNGITTSIPIVNSSGIVVSQFNDIDSENLLTANGSNNWSLFQLFSSLSNQIQSCDLVSKLANLAMRNDFSFSDFSSVVSSYGDKLSVQCYQFIDQLKSIPGELNQLTLVQALQRIYTSISNADTNGDTIEFDTNNYFLKSFNGTIVKQLITSGAQFLGQVLLFAGSTILKIAGGIIYAGSLLIPYLQQNLGMNENAIIKPGASQYNYAPPIFQIEINKTSVSNNILSIINNNRVSKLSVYPFDLFLWTNDVNDSKIKVAGYLNLLFNGNITSSYAREYGGGASKLIEVQELHPSVGVTNIIVRLNMDSHATSLSQTCISFDEAFHFGDSSANNAYSIFTDESDEYARMRVTKALATVYYYCAQWNVISNNHFDEYKTSGFQIFSANYNLTDPKAIINTYFSNFPQQTWTISGLLAITSYAIYNNIPLTWEQIQNWAIGTGLPTYFEYYQNELIIPLLDDSTLKFSSQYGSIVRVNNFRSDLCVTPPNYSQGSALRAIVTVLAAAAAITAIAITTKVVINRTMSGIMTDKYVKVQQKWNTLNSMQATDVNYKSVRSDYLKSVRRYNLLATFTGFSTLSSVSGWENGASSTTLSKKPYTNLDNLEKLQALTLGTSSLSSNGNDNLISINSSITDTTNALIHDVKNLIKLED